MTVDRLLRIISLRFRSLLRRSDVERESPAAEMGFVRQKGDLRNRRHVC